MSMSVFIVLRPRSHPTPQDACARTGPTPPATHAVRRTAPGRARNDAILPPLAPKPGRPPAAPAGAPTATVGSTADPRRARSPSGRRPPASPTGAVGSVRRAQRTRRRRPHAFADAPCFQPRLTNISFVIYASRARNGAPAFGQVTV